MIPQYAGTPSGTGPALPNYLSDAEQAAQDEEIRRRALCDVDGLADWLCGECMGKSAYSEGRSSQDIYDERALCIAPVNAQHLSAPELLALAMGLASDPRARIAAMNELAKRAGVGK